MAEVSATPARLGAGNHFSLVLDPVSGRLVSFGENLFAQLGRAPVGQEINPEPGRVAAPEAVAEISAGLLHGALLTDGGEVWSWGYGLSGRLGHGDTAQQDAPKRIAALDGVTIVAITMANGASYAIDDEGRLWAWGQNSNGQLGLGAAPESPGEPADGPLVPTLVTALDRFDLIEVAAGTSHTLALTGTGEVLAFGGNAQGQIGPGGEADEGEPARRVLEPVAVALPDEIVAVGTGNNTSYAVTASGEVWGWGETRYGQLLVGTIAAGVLVQGEGDEASIVRPVRLQGLPDDIVAVSGGARWALALTAGGEVWGWGRNNEGWLGIETATGEADTLLAPTRITAFDGIEIVEITVGTNHALARDSAGHVYGWGASADGRLTLPDDAGPVIGPVRIDLDGDAAPVRVGTGAADALAAGIAASDIYGFGGADELLGSARDDALFGGLDGDRLRGRDGADALDGGIGDDRLSGGLGDDRLEGGAGRNRLSGGEGADLFVLDPAGFTVLRDFDAGEGDAFEVEPGAALALREAGDDLVVTLTGTAIARILGASLDDVAA